MKKYLLGLFAVIVAVGLSAFTTPKEKRQVQPGFTTYYWFDVNSGDGDETSFNNGQVSYISGSTPGETPPENSCDENGDNYCVVGFTISQVTGAPNYVLKTGQHSPGPISVLREQP